MRSRRRRGRRRRRPGRTRRGSGRRGRRMRPRRRSVYPRPAVVGSRRRRSGEGLRASREHRRGCENSGYLSYSSPKWARHKLSPRLFSIRYFYLNGLFIQRLCVSTVFPVPACAEASSAWGPVRASVPVCVSHPGFGPGLCIPGPGLPGFGPGWCIPGPGLPGFGPGLCIPGPGFGPGFGAG